MSLNNQNSVKQSLEERRKWIEEKLNDIFTNQDKSDIFSLDFEINMLICSAQSYKHETVLKPFPSTFLSDSNNDKNYDGLLNALLTMPPLSQWRAKIKSFNEDQLALIHWLLVHKSYNLKLVTDMNMEKLKEMAHFHEQVANPTHIFEINYSEDKNKKFENLKQQTEAELNSQNNANKPVVSTNFHGTRMDNLYSIMHIGLLSHFSKNALFGEGTYLSQEPSISLHYSPSNKTWENSIIGQRMSCLLVCETINHPQHVKIGLNETGSSHPNQKSNVPEKYFIVKNNEYVRLKYICLYAEKTKIKRRNRLVQFLSENKFAFLLISYAILLIFVGLLNSRSFHKYIKLSYQKLSNYLLGEASSSSATYE